MKNLIKILILPLLGFIISCNQILGLNDYEKDVDTEPVGTIDYWVDGYCPGTQLEASDDCSGISEIGCCDEKGALLYCSDDKLYCVGCMKNPTASYCSWESISNYYTCTTEDNGEDPSNKNSIGCFSY
jgi:hypothetical protein